MARGALDEYAPTISRIEAQLRDRAAGIRVSSGFDFDTTAQKFVVNFAAGRPFTLLIEKSAFEAFQEEKLLTLVGGVTLAPGGKHVLTDRSE